MWEGEQQEKDFGVEIDYVTKDRGSEMGESGRARVVNVPPFLSELKCVIERVLL